MMKKIKSDLVVHKETEPSQVVGVRLPKRFAISFKKEAAARNIRVNELFLEMWDLYKREKGKT